MTAPSAPSTGVRWMMFNGVGLLGALVQLAVLGLLVHVAHVGYLFATPVAVEAALLHNFAWHRRWTWRDRAAAAGGPSPWTALGRFHAANGAVSLAGNVAVMALAAGALHLPPVAANVVAILVCSLVNYALGDRWVFGWPAAARPQAPASLPGGGSDELTAIVAHARRGLRTRARCRCTTG